MTKKEFITEVKSITGSEPVITEDLYNVISFVYTYHPSIDEVKGKKQIAYLFAEFGKFLIFDMFPRAKEVEQAEQEMINAKTAYEKAVESYKKVLNKEI